MSGIGPTISYLMHGQASALEDVLSGHGVLLQALDVVQLDDVVVRNRQEQKEVQVSVRVVELVVDAGQLPEELFRAHSAS